MRISFLRHWSESGGILLMSYGQFRTLLYQDQEQEVLDYYLIDPGPDVVVLDEAHQIKNATSQISQLVQNFQTPARICLTGYPLQNNVKEYYHMLNFIAPGILGSVDEFTTRFGSWVENVYADTTKNLQEMARKKMYALQLITSRVTHRMDQTILRKDLPEKNDISILFKLSSAQHVGYVRFLNEFNSENVFNPLSGLMWLRGICNHPKIFQTIMRKRVEAKDAIKQLIYKKESIVIDVNRLNESNDDGISYELTDEELLNSLDNKEANWIKTIFKSEDIESWKCSGKMSFVLDLARKCKELGEKLVVVSHSIVTLDFIQHLLLVFGINVNRLDGSTPQADRQAIIDEFHVKSDIQVILLSAKAAAIGVNVTCASRIVLVDQDWNPLYDEQSIGRIYRYGQQKPVFVYRCITQGTIEEAINSQSIHKSSIARHVIDNKPSMLELKKNQKMYYKVPEKDAPSVDLNDIDKDILKDPITSYIINENQNMISDVKPFSLIAVGLSLNDLSEQDRKDAKNEAKKILGHWISRNRKNRTKKE
ncbi:hypothetical protein K501DRAFT_169246 [Backusella circina FSU 941]|nr:hypothetical protein K501DRAFT_169246 [Backusella circina FSU 941]